MLSDLTPSQRCLADFMSEISERCWRAGWLQNLEYALWYAVLNGPMQYGQGTVSQMDIDSLTQLSEAGNCWIVFDGPSEETAVGLSSWRAIFELESKSGEGLPRRAQ